MLWLFWTVIVAEAWNYVQQGKDWTGLCSTGGSQSPINIQKAQTQTLGREFAMEVYYYGQTMSRTVNNTGNYISISGNFGYITIADSSGNIRQFTSNRIEFHIPSEHYLEGYPTHMEMQIFHTVENRDYTFDFPTTAVVSVMLRPGDDSYFFNSINVANLPSAGKSNVLPSNSNVNLLSIVSPDDNYFFYKGSLNEPNCDENVLWYVFETQQWISFVQIGYFQSLFMPGQDVFGGGGDSRAIQNTNGRVVYYSSAQWLAAVILGLLF
jgi:carbonic anhydrase